MTQIINKDIEEVFKDEKGEDEEGEDENDTKYLIDKLFNENKDEKSQTSKILNEGDSLSIIPHKYETHNRNKISIQQPITKYGTFSLNYIPLSLIFIYY